MTDDQLAAAAEIFKHFDSGKVASEQTRRLKEWILSAFCWDGLLPIAVLLIPKLMSLLFAGWRGVLEITFLVVPTVAFVIRYVIGMRRFREGQMYRWQLALFFVAIFLLFGLDAALVMAAVVRDRPPAAFWYFWFSMYGFYFLIMAVAMFPARAQQREDAFQNHSIRPGKGN